MHTRLLRVLALALALALLGAALPGCARTGSLSGKVSYKGKTLAYGAVTVIGSDGIPVTGNIGLDGTYEIPALPTGPAKVGVVSPDPVVEAEKLAKWQRKGGGRPTKVDKRKGKKEDTPPLANPPDRSKWFAIPDRYGVPESSGLTLTVKGGPNTHDIDLPN